MRDVSGLRFGRLVAVSLGARQNGRIRWRCACDCGGESTVLLSNLTSGRQRSCGCLAAEVRRERNDQCRKTPDEKAATRRARTRRWAAKNATRTYADTKADPVKWAATLKRAREWARRNPQHKNAMTRNRRARIKGAAGTHTREEVWALMVAQSGLCAICEGEVLLDFHVDHVVPVSKGGRNDIENLQILCPPCNLSKSDKVPVGI